MKLPFGWFSRWTSTGAAPAASRYLALTARWEPTLELGAEWDPTIEQTARWEPTLELMARSE